MYKKIYCTCCNFFRLYTYNKYCNYVLDLIV